MRLQPWMFSFCSANLEECGSGDRPVEEHRGQREVGADDDAGGEYLLQLPAVRAPRRRHPVLGYRHDRPW